MMEILSITVEFLQVIAWMAGIYFAYRLFKFRMKYNSIISHLEKEIGMVENLLYLREKYFKDKKRIDYENDLKLFPHKKLFQVDYLKNLKSKAEHLKNMLPKD